jgi:hypothetical protein
LHCPAAAFVRDAASCCPTDNAALADPQLKNMGLREQGLEPAGNSPEEFAQVMHSDIASGFG